MDVPPVRFARSGDASIAYQVVGDGPIDLICSPFLGHRVLDWLLPFGDFYERLASFGRLIVFDKRGAGLSDRPQRLPDVETRMDDIRAVLDAVESEQAVLIAPTSTAPLACVFAATYPQRTRALVLFNAVARLVRAPDYPFGVTRDEADARLRRIREEFELGTGEREHLAAMLFPLEDPAKIRELARLYELSAMSPSTFVAFTRTLYEVDVREFLPTIRVPTLVMYRVGMPIAPGARDLAERIQGARAVELPGTGAIASGPEPADAIEQFVGSLEAPQEPDTVLATVLFTDLVGSTERAAAVGDREWGELIGRHHRLVRAELARYGGIERDTAGDGFFATFDGPARAIRAAQSIVTGVRSLGLELRAGVHTGECRRHETKVAGLAVSIGARIAATAVGGEVLVSQTVRDLVVGSELTFVDREEHELKGVPGTWRLFAVAPE
jgi:class 3 adenylate cyclase